MYANVKYFCLFLYLGVPCNYPQGSYDRYSDPSTRQCRCRVSIVIIPWRCTNDNNIKI